MSLADLQVIVWRELPLRKRIAGRQVVNDLVQLAVEAWPAESMGSAADDAERDAVCQEVERSVKRMYFACSSADNITMGILWVFLLQALASIVVKKILEWWLERHANRALLLAWQHELTK